MRLSLILTALLVLAALVVSGAADEIDGESVDSSIVSVESGTERPTFSSYKIMDYQQINTFSPDNTRVVYMGRNDAGYWYYIIAGPEGEIIEKNAYYSPRDFVFSQDGEHYAYKVLNNSKWMAVVDGSEGREYDEVWNSIVFSHDGERYAYSATKDGQSFMVVDGIEYGPYKSVSDPIISSGGQHVLYTMVEEGNDHYVVVDGVVQDLMGSHPIVSPDGSRWAYSFGSMYTGSPCYIVLDDDFIDLGKDESNRVAQMVFSPMGTRLAYDLVPGGNAYGDHIVVVDGVPGKRYHDPGVGTIVFSSDESTVAYWAKAEDGGFVMVMNGEEGKIYNKIGDPIISPDGSHVAYIVEESDGMFVVSDGIEGKKYESIWGLTFSLDGRLAYAASDTRDEGYVHLVVVDGQEDLTYRHNGHFAGIRSNLAFSPDGEHIAYLANDAGTEEFVVVDSIRYANPWWAVLKMEPQNLVWDSAEAFHYIGYNYSDSGVYLGTVTVPSPPQDKKVVDLGESLVKLPDESSLIQTEEWGEVPANQVIIVLAEGFGRDYADSIASSKLDGRVVGFIEYINLYQIETSGATQADLIEAISRAENDPNVEIAVPNQQGHLSISPLDDPVYADGRDTGYEIVGVKQAWDAILASGLPLAEVQVGVTDDGLYRGWGEFDNAEIGVDEKNADLPYPLEGDLYEIAGSHGTGVMNIITADADDGGITGVASFVLGQKLSATMINIFDEPYGNSKEVESRQDPSYPVEYVYGGKTYAIGSLVALKNEIESGSTILSCSWGTADYTKTEPAIAAVFKRFFEKISADQPYILFVCAAGNDGVSMDGSRYWPSGLNLANMITVGNLMNDGTKCDSSNIISDNFEVTLAAPGQQSVWGRDDKGNIVNYNGGTSMATPHVTAAAAMIRSLDPSLNAKEIKKILMDTARSSINLDGKQVAAPPELGGRILAIDLAVERVIGDLGGASIKKFPTEPSSGIRHLDSALSRGISQGAEETIPTDITDRFSTEDGSVFSSVKIGPVYGTHTVAWKWYSPDGSLYVDHEEPIIPETEGGDHWAWSSILIKGRDAEDMPGDWRLDVTLDGSPLLTEKFYLIEAADAGKVEGLILDLKDENSSVRENAAVALGEIGDPRAVNPLIETLEDEDWGVRYWAAQALGEIGDTRAVNPLIEALKDYGMIRINAAEALGEIGDPRAVDPLIETLEDEDSADLVRESAAYALGEIGDTKAVDPLIATLNDKDPYIRNYAARALGKIGDTRAVDLLIDALSDEEGFVRVGAYVALMEIGEPAIDPLIDALKNENKDVRGWAANALGEIGDPRAVDPLIDALEDESKYVREAATEALEKIQSE
ncbi:MAG TPA: HEAT repeat domain-containing protein [Methanothrix sp.]|nr:HEAT repeat domain-containing protein [Methanothrix sp.]